MKKIFLSITLFLGVFGTSFSQVCTPFPIPGGGFIYPDSATNLPPAYANSPYETVISFRVPTDTIYLGINVPISKILVETDSITVTPPLTGFSFNCNPGNCSFPGGTEGCAKVSANPTISEVGVHFITIIAKGYVDGGLFGEIEATREIIDYYKIDVGQPNGFGDLKKLDGFEAVFSPNPSNGERKGNVSVFAPKRGRAKGKGFNPNGALIWEQDFDLQEGMNNQSIDFGDFSNGLYFFTIQSDFGVTSTKVVISK